MVHPVHPLLVGQVAEESRVRGYILPRRKNGETFDDLLLQLADTCSFHLTSSRQFARSS
jgi:hypothetical protein